MVTLLLSSVLFLAVLAIAIYFWQKPANPSQSIELPPPPEPRGLFSDFSVNQLRSPTDSKPPEIAREVDEQIFREAIDAIRAFQRSPDRHSTAKLLHAAARSDDPKNYGRAIELVLLSWRDGSLSDLSAKDLQALINSEYWVLSSPPRTSGAGFVLKETLSNANCELETTYKPN
jgi:hypothetical protein